MLRSERDLQTVSSAVAKLARHPGVASTGSKLLRLLCASAEGRAAVTVHNAEVGNVRGATFGGLLRVAALHGRDPAVVADALAALALLMDDESTLAWEFLSEARQLAVIVDVLRRHADNAAVAEQALHIVACAQTTDDFHRQLVGEGMAALGATLLGKHVETAAIARDASELMRCYCPEDTVPGAKASELSDLLTAVLQRYDEQAREKAAVDGGDAAGVAAAVAVIAAAMRALVRLAMNAPAVPAQLVGGAAAFQLVACMRRHMSDPIAAAPACELLLAIAQAGPSVMAPLVLAGAVPLLLDVLERHEANERVVRFASAAFARFANDPATLLQLAEERPVLLLRNLLRRYLHSSDVLLPLLGGCFPAISREESGRAVLMDSGAAPETLRLLLEAARIHRGEPNISALAVGSAGLLCKAYGDYIAAHEAGVPAAALELMQCAELKGDELFVSAACSLIGKVGLHEAVREQLLRDGAPAAVIAVMKRFGPASSASCNGIAALRRFFEQLDKLKPAQVAAALPLVVATMRSNIGNGDAVANASYCIGCAVPFSPDVVCKAGPVPLLHKALRLHMAELTPAHAILTALAGLATVPRADGAGAVAEAKLLTDVLAALEKHSAREDVAFAACGVITGVAAWPSGAAEVGRSIDALLPAVARALRLHLADDDSSAPAAACSTLCVLSRTAAYRRHFARGAAIPSLLAVLRRFVERAGDAGFAWSFESTASMALSAVAGISSAAECVSLLRTLKAQDLVPAVLARLDVVSEGARADMAAAAAALTRSL